MSYSMAFSQAVSIIVYTAVKIEAGYVDYVSSRLLSEQLEIPGPSVVKILQSLNRVGLTETKEGAKGGIRLAKPPENITLLDVFHAIELDRPLFKFALPAPLIDEKSLRIGERIADVLRQAEHNMRVTLSETRIADLYR